jgi:quinol monooxygenase YgiN
MELRMILPVEEKQRERFLESVRGLVARTMAEEGCLECGLGKGKNGNRSVVLSEKWRDGESLGAHVKGRNFRKLLIALDLLSGPPTVTLAEPPGTAVAMNIEKLCRVFGGYERES